MSRTAARRLDPTRLVRAALLAGFGLLILKLLLSGQMPRYLSASLDPLMAATGFVMLALGGAEAAAARLSAPGAADPSHDSAESPAEQAATYGLLAGMLLFGLLVAPRALGTSALAGEDLANYLLTFDPRIVPQTSSAVRPDRPVEDVGDLMTYLGRVGEGGVGQRVRVTGLVSKSGGLRADEFPLLRFMIVHCVADARPVGFLVTNIADRPDLDQWVRVEGVVAVQERAGDRLLAIEATSVEPVVEPSDPYIHPS